MRYGIINRIITDLRDKPSFRSGRKSQLLFGLPVEIGRVQKGYLKATQNDGYFGWVDHRAVTLFSKLKLTTYKKKLNYIVISKTAKITVVDKNPDNRVNFLLYGTRIDIIKKNGNYGIFTTPDGDKYKIALKNITPILKAPSKDFYPRQIINEAKKFLGIPYLWGGVSTFGFDCSGLVQSVYSRFGIILPRDSKDQMKKGNRVNRDHIQCGDLLFFPGHVAIAIDKYRIIHASLAEGGVAINSLNPKAKNFRPDLFETFIEARRVIV